jgi:peptidoglycan hydrolase CwlO-like protein
MSGKLVVSHLLTAVICVSIGLVLGKLNSRTPVSEQVQKLNSEIQRLADEKETLNSEVKSLQAVVERIKSDVIESVPSTTPEEDQEADDDDQRMASMQWMMHVLAFSSAVGISSLSSKWRLRRT